MDNFVITKVASIQRCVSRAREEFTNAGDHFDSDYTHQDAAVMNVVRACELAIDLANHVVRVRQAGLPSTSRDAFTLLQDAGLIDEVLEDKMIRMIGFRYVVVHAYQQMDLGIVRSVIRQGLDDVLAFANGMNALEA